MESREVYGQMATQKDLFGNKRDDWDFKDADTKYGTHGLFYYPARMSPQVARKLLLKYSREDDTIWDPFCGSGTTLVEAELNRRHAIGIDVNPFAVLLSRVKATPLPDQSDQFHWDQFNARVTENARDAGQDMQPEKAENAKNAAYELKLKNVHEWLHKWFQSRVVRDLLAIKRTMLEDFVLARDAKVLDFYKVGFARTIARVSNAVYDGSSTHTRKNLQENGIIE